MTFIRNYFNYYSTVICRLLPVALAALLFSGNANAQAVSGFSDGWILDNNSSSLTFQSVKTKDGIKLETSSFAAYSGNVDNKGRAEITVMLDSIDTKVDLRNVRMRFLLFETFKYPEATVTANIDPALIADLWSSYRVNVPLSFELDLHGTKQTFQVETVVTALMGNKVSVASAAPIPIPTNLFGLDGGVKKLEEAAKVEIVPIGTVSFNLVFNVDGSVPEAILASANATSDSSTANSAEPASAEPASAALESVGNLSTDECITRFETLSQTGAIYFRFGSEVLDEKSKPLLVSVVDIIQRCPELQIVVSGHTDSQGSEEVNQWLSERRALSVREYLTTNAVDGNRVRSIGYGESNPIDTNDTVRGRERNRRIEFSIDKT